MACLFMFGILCIVEGIFEIIMLLMMVGGRKSSHTTVERMGSTTSYTTVIEKHPFFDPTQGFKYNLQSVVRICSPAVMLFAACLSYFTYQAFPDSLFSPADEEAVPVLRGSGGHGG